MEISVRPMETRSRSRGEMEIREPSRVSVEGFEARGQCQEVGTSREVTRCTPIKGIELDQRSRLEIKD